MGIRTSGGTMSRILSRTFGNAGVGCIVRNGGVILAEGGSGTVATRRSEMAMGKIIASRGNSPVVNTGMLRGNAAGNYVASVRNGFALGMPDGTALTVACVNCRPRGVRIGKQRDFGIGLRRRTVTLRRMIMATVNVGGGRTSLACSARRINNSRLAHTGSPGVVGTLTNGATNMRVAGDSSKLNNSTGISVHNDHSVDKGGRPLCIVSNMPVLGDDGRRTSATVNNATSTNGHSNNSNVSGLGPSSVRDVDVLGKTSTTTLCNSRTTGNIVLVAAGGNGTNVRGVAFSSGLAMSRTVYLPRFRGGCTVSPRTGGD